MRVAKGDPDYDRLIAAFEYEGRPRVLRRGNERWTWYQDGNELFFVGSKTTLGQSEGKSMYAAEPQLPRTNEPPLK